MKTWKERLVKIYRKDRKEFLIKSFGRWYHVFYRITLEETIERQLGIIKYSNKNFNKEDYIVEKLNHVPKELYNQLHNYMNNWQQNVLNNINLYPSESFDMATQIKKSILK